MAPIEVSRSNDDVAFNGVKRTRVSCNVGGDPTKKPKMDSGINLPDFGLIDSISPDEAIHAVPISMAPPPPPSAGPRGFRQFWKAGDYEGPPASCSAPAGIDHVRVHPKFLHSNATSHKWALGALAELLDNSMDEVCHGATFVNIDMLKNTKDGTRMLLVEDNGGGMDPDKMRHCMSLGYSMKSKLANTIGQYGNGFKTSTMRLGADAIVFSRCPGKEGKSSTQSIGLLSYTFLRNTGKEDIVVPMIDYEKGEVWNKMTRSSSDVWKNNLETIIQWSPYYSEADLVHQLNLIGDQGTRVVIYNLWDDDQGELELDFDTDEHDIQVRGCNRDEKKIQMAKQFPNSRHFLTYRHSLRSYASILYRRIPNGFRMVLRGKEVEHHNIVNDMMLKSDVTYRPQPGPDGVSKDPNMVAVVTLGFVKDAKDHIDVQGFNVYHKNRLIKPFWRVWNAAGSDGRGVIGVLEANFVEPAHDKQGFERTTVLSRLEARLIHLQKQYWSTNCHKIGYAPRHHKKVTNGPEDRESPPEDPQPSSEDTRKDPFPSNISPDSRKRDSARRKNATTSVSHSNCGIPKSGASNALNGKSVCPTVQCNGNGSIVEISIQQLTNENNALKLRLKNLELKILHDLQFERDKNQALAEQLAAIQKKTEILNEEREALMNIFQEERSRRDEEEINLKKELEVAASTIDQLTAMLNPSGNYVKQEKLGFR